MARVKIDEVIFEVPDSGMKVMELKDTANLPADSTLYRITPEGQHDIMDNNDKVVLKDGDRVGSVTRFTAALMRKR